MIARLCKVDWEALGAKDWFPCLLESGEFHISSDRAPTLRRVSDGGDERIESADATSPKYCKAYAVCGMSMKFAQAAWLRYAKC